MSDLAVIKAMTQGAYDLQKVRIATGLRLCANFRSRLSVDERTEDQEKGELSERAEKILDQLRTSYRRLTDGVARNRSLPDESGFRGDELIHSHAELALLHAYISLEKQEAQLFRLLEPMLQRIPIYATWLQHQVGVGPAMGAIMVTLLDPHRARHPSSFWKIAGLDVVNGVGRSRRAEHLVEHKYTDRNGQTKTRVGVTFNPLLKTKLMGVLATSFLRQSSPWRDIYDGYRHRLTTDPAREKVTIAQWKNLREAGEEVGHLWPPGRIHNAALRYMIKMFLAQLWLQWRTLEGLDTGGGPYAEGKLGQRHAA